MLRLQPTHFTVKPRGDSPRSQGLQVESYMPRALEDSTLPSPRQAPAPSLTSSPWASVSSSVKQGLSGLFVKTAETLLGKCSAWDEVSTNWGTKRLERGGAGPLKGASASKEGPPDPQAPTPSCWTEPLAQAAGHLLTWPAVPGPRRQLPCQDRKLRQTGRQSHPGGHGGQPEWLQHPLGRAGGGGAGGKRAHS